MANNVLYGFHNLQDLKASRIAGSLVTEVTDAIDQAVAEHNRQVDALISLFARRTTEYTQRYHQAGAARLQPLDNNGRARPIKPAGQYDVAFPLQAGGAAWGANYVTRIKMTVAEAERATAMMMVADSRWIRDHILAALYTNVTWSFTDELYGALTVQPLANNDTVTYQMQVGGDTGAIAQHFFAQVAAIADATNPYPTIQSTLKRHPGNTGEVVAFIPTNLKATTQALATFHDVADANLQRGANSTVLVGGLDMALPGTVIGYEESGVFIVEWPALPDNYIIATTTGGESALAMREDAEAELQGFNKVAERDDHPFYESQFLRRAGFGAWNRANGVVYRIGNAAYAIPTNYTSPMG